MNAIQPTEAELRMIQLQREKEAIEKKEAEAKKAIKIEKDITAAENDIVKLIDGDSEQIKTATVYHTTLSKISDNYKIDFILKDLVINVYGDYINPDNPKEHNYDRVVCWSKTIKRRSAVINYFNSINNTNYAVSIREHMSYSGYRTTNQGYKMYISGPGIEYNTSNRAYKTPSKVHEIITETIESINRKTRMEEKKKSVLVDTVTKMKELYPNAKITEGYDYERVHRGNNSIGERYDTITINFTNGINIKYRVYSDGSLGRLHVGVNTGDEWSLMEILNKIPNINPVP